MPSDNPGYVEDATIFQFEPEDTVSGGRRDSNTIDEGSQGVR